MAPSDVRTGTRTAKGGKTLLRRSTFVALILVVALVGACGGSDGDGSAEGPGQTSGTSSPSETCTAEHVGGTVTAGVTGLPTGVDPVAATGSGSTGGIELAQFYDTLMRYDPDSGTYEPRVAESLEANDDDTVWTMTLRPDVTFGNGDPLTADAVKASIERYQELSKGPYKNLALKIKQMEVRDDKTIVFTLTEPWTGFPFTLANGPGMIVNPAIVAQKGEGFAADPTGAGVGAYELVSFAPNEELVYRAKSDYWGGPVCIEELRFRPLAADSGRYEAFQTGEFQAAFLRDPLQISMSMDDDVAGFDTYSNAQTVLLFNGGASESAVNAVELRKAIAQAMNVEALNERAFEGAGNAETSVIGSGSRFADGLEGLPFDTDGASDAVTKAKSQGWDGSLSLTCAQSQQEVALTLEAQLEAVGISIDLNLVPDFSTLINEVGVKKEFDLACWGFNGLDEGLWATLNSSLVSTSPANYGGLKDPGIDAAMDELRVANDEAGTKAALDDLQGAMNDAVPAVPLFHGYNRVIHADDLVGITPTANSLVFFSSAFLKG